MPGSLRSRRLGASAACLLLLAVALMVAAPPSQAATPAQVTFTLEGCDRPPGLTLPRPDGQFICPDANYGPGNMGENWSELDLVPFRLTARIKPTQTFTVVIAADAADGSEVGFDQMSEPKLNRRLSGPGCQEPVVGDQIEEPGLGSVDVTILREVTVVSVGDETCVYDWHQRLAMGSGSSDWSVKTSLLNEELTTSGIGSKTVPLDTGGVEAQSLSKIVKAGRGDGYLWAVSKTNVASTTSVDTCIADPTSTFTTTISWTRTPVTGDVTWVTQVFATNPSSRQLNVQVEDVVSADGTEVDRTTGPAVGVPALSTNVKVLEHAGTAPAGTTIVSDAATATYLDPDTGTPIPGSTTAYASAPVTVTAAGNPTAEVSDVTTATQPLALMAMTEGTADSALGEFVTPPITWQSGTVAQSGSATLTFAAALPAEFAGTVTVTDQATLTDTIGGQVRASALASVVGSPSPPRATLVKNVDVAPTRDATFFFSLWLSDANGQKTTAEPILDGVVTIPAGATSSGSAEVTLPPSPFGYIWEEVPAPGYVTPDPGLLAPMDVCDSAVGVVTNTRAVGSIEVTKVVDGPTVGASATADVVVDCPGAEYDETLAVAPGVPAETGPIPTGTTCTMSEPDPPPGYELVGVEPSQVVVTEGPTPAGVTVTNQRLIGELTVTKLLEGDPAGAGTTFTAHVDCEAGDTYDTDVLLTVIPPATAQSSEPLQVPVGVTCSVTEPDVPDGWALSGITPAVGQVTIGSAPSEVTITNARVQGALVVQKVTDGAALGADTEFAVDVECSDGFTDTVLLDVGDRGAAFAVINGIASGSTCTISEDNPPVGWELVDITPNPVVVSADQTDPAVVTVANQRQTGRLDIVKQAIGPIAGAGQNFTVHLDCAGDQHDADLTMRVPGDDGDTAATIGGIPTGVECTLTEPDVPDGWTLTGIEPNPVTVTDTDTEVDATITNTRVLGALTVTKRLGGDVAGADTTFTMHVDCPDAGIEQDLTLTVSNGLSASQTIDGLPTGVACIVTETTIADGWRLGLILPEQVQIGEGEPVVVTVTNIRETGGIGLTKSLSGPISGAPTTFSAFLDCDGAAYDQTVSLAVTPPDLSETVLIDGIPTGTHCVFTEPSIPPQWTLGGIASNEITIETTDIVEVDVVNVRVLGELDVVKQINGSVDEDVSFDLALDCSDDLFDTLVPVDIPSGSTTVTESFSGIPTDVTCQVAEPTLPLGWTVESIEPASVIISEEPATITVTDTAAVPFPSPTPTPPTQTPPPDGTLSGTGGVVPWALLGAGALLAVGGIALLATRRRRRA